MDCPFWGEAIPVLRSMRSTTPEQRYQAVFDIAEKQFGPEAVIVDSSKTARGLRALTQVPDVNALAIHLVKDVRSWIVSMQETYKRNKSASLSDNVRQEGAKKGVLRYLKHRKLYDAWHWYRENRRIQKLAAERNLPLHAVSYEQLCLDLQQSLERLAEFLEIDADSFGSMEHRLNGVSHNTTGNRMRLQWAENKEIKYDYRWLTRRDWVWPVMAFPNILRYNTELVYRNRSRT